MSSKLAVLLLGACAAHVATRPVFAAEAAPHVRQIQLDNARIFPFFAAGGGWESTLQLLNVSDSNFRYRLSFYGVNGQPAQVAVQSPDGRVTSVNTIEVDINDDASHTYVLVDTGALQTGWARLDYDGESRLAGVLTFRQRVPGRPDFASSVTLVREDENRVFMPFDNANNFATSLALTNPSDGDSTDLQLRFWDASGAEITTKEIRLSPGTTVSFSLREQYPELNGRTGMFRIEGSASGLSVLALRFNPDGAFSTIPVTSR